LRQAEAAGEQVTSWYCRELWRGCQLKIQTDEHALRLSKLLRDNRHTFMTILREIADDGRFTFLAIFLGLEYAAKEPEFVNLRIQEHRTAFDAIREKERGTKYVIEQQARRVRVAFTSLAEYFTKENRNEHVIRDAKTDSFIQQARILLTSQPEEMTRLDIALQTAIEQKSEEQLRMLVQQIPCPDDIPVFVEARRLLESSIALIAQQLLVRWDDPRYVREYQDDSGEEPPDIVLV
jgi:hypothetical protein